MSRQVPHAEDTATGTPTAGLVPISAGPGLAPAWGAAGGGGGGGGGLTLLAEFTCVGGEQTVRLPASGSLTTGFKGLLAFAQARSNTDTTLNGRIVLRLNGDTASHYANAHHLTDSSGTHIAEGNHVGLSYAPVTHLTSAGRGDGGASGARVHIPFASRSTFWQQILSESADSYNAGDDVELHQYYAEWRQLAAVADLSFLAWDVVANGLLAGGFVAGSYFAVYGIQ
jgi:hypothetical protein